MDRDLDTRVAEAMGLVPCDNWQHFHAGTMIKIDATCGHEACYPRGRLAHYSIDIAAARTFEDWLESRGPDQVRAYTEALCVTVGYNHHWTNLKLLWHVAHATPEQRCRAFLKAMEAQPSATQCTDVSTQDSTHHRDV